MKKFKIPALSSGMAISDSSKKKRFPSVAVPIQKGWGKYFPVGEEVKVHLMGTVKSVRISDNESDYDRSEAQLEIHEVIVDEGTDFTKLSEPDEEEKED